MRRKVLTLVLALASVLTMTGCSGSSVAAHTGTALKFYSDKQNWEPQFDAVSDAWKADGGSGLDIYGYSDTDQYTSFIKQAMTTNEKPTLFTWHTGPELQDLARAGYVQDTDQIWDQGIKDGVLDPSLRPQFEVDGKTYCVPLNTLYNVIYYNVHVFDKLHLSPPTTWQELMHDCDVLVKNGYTPFYETNSTFQFTWFQTLVGGYDPQLYTDLSTGKASYTDPEVVSLMQTWKSMIEKGYFADATSSYTESASLASGKVAMLNWESFIGPSLQDLDFEPMTDYKAFVIPPINPNVTKTPVYVEASPLCAATNTPDAKQAYSFLQWWVTDDAQSVWAKASSGISFDPNVPVGDPALQGVADTIGSGNVQLLPRYYDVTPTPILTVAEEQLSSWVTSPGDPTKTLQQIQKAADKYWASQ